MLAICDVLIRRHMPTEISGEDDLPAPDRNFLTLHDIYEKFVASFYQYHLEDWSVHPQQTINWPASPPSDYVPTMKPDLTLQHADTGRVIVLDTKFTASSLTSGQWGTIRFNRDHLFQIYAYLRSQDGTSRERRFATGILLYPAVNHDLSETVEIQGHEIRWETVDLAQAWRKIEEDLLSIPKHATSVRGL